MVNPANRPWFLDFAVEHRPAVVLRSHEWRCNLFFPHGAKGCLVKMLDRTLDGHDGEWTVFISPGIHRRYWIFGLANPWARVFDLGVGRVVSLYSARRCNRKVLTDRASRKS